jgi:hypothetical protein
VRARSNIDELAIVVRHGDRVASRVSKKRKKGVMRHVKVVFFLYSNKLRSYSEFITP